MTQDLVVSIILSLVDISFVNFYHPSIWIDIGWMADGMCQQMGLCNVDCLEQSRDLTI